MYNVIFDGKTAHGKDAQAVKNAFQATFKLGDQAVDSLFSGRKVKLKKNMERGPAEKFIAKLGQTGAICKLEKAAFDQASHSPPENNITQSEQKPSPPLLQVLPLKPNDLFIHHIGYNILNILLIGLYFVPNMLFGYMLNHMQINGHPIKLRKRITYLKPLFGAFLMMAISLAIAGTIGSIGQALEKAGFHQGIISVFLILSILFIAIALVSPGVGFLILLQSLLDSAELNNRKLCKPIYSDMRGMIKFIKSNFWKICRWSIASFPVLLFPAWPPFWSRLTNEWFNRMEVDGYGFNFTMPPKIVRRHIEFAIITIGLSGFFFIGRLFNQIISNGEWVLSE